MLMVIFLTVFLITSPVSFCILKYANLTTGTAIILAIPIGLLLGTIACASLSKHIQHTCDREYIRLTNPFTRRKLVLYMRYYKPVDEHMGGKSKKDNEDEEEDDDFDDDD